MTEFVNALLMYDMEGIIAIVTDYVCIALLLALFLGVLSWCFWQAVGFFIGLVKN